MENGNKSELKIYSLVSGAMLVVIFCMNFRGRMKITTGLFVVLCVYAK